MSGTILVGYDGTPSAKVALDWALRRAEGTGLDVDVLYVADTSWDSEAFTATPHLEQHGAVVLADAAFHADSKAPHSRVTPRVLTGDPVEVLCTEAEATGAEMLVVGCYRKDLYERITTSAVSLRLAAAATVPVAVIPDLPHTHRRRVIVGVDGGEASASVVAVAAAEAARLDEPLTVLSAWSLPPMTMSDFGDDSVLYDALEERAKSGVAAALTRVDTSAVAVDTQVVLDSPVTALLAASKDAALLVVGSHGRRGLSRFLLGSVSHDILVHAAGPTLVIRVRA